MKYIDTDGDGKLDTIFFDDGSRCYVTDLEFFKTTTRRSFHLPIIRMIKIQNILKSIN